MHIFAVSLKVFRILRFVMCISFLPLTQINRFDNHKDNFTLGEINFDLHSKRFVNFFLKHLISTKINIEII